MLGKLKCLFGFHAWIRYGKPVDQLIVGGQYSWYACGRCSLNKFREFTSKERINELIHDTDKLLERINKKTTKPKTTA